MGCFFSYFGSLSFFSGGGDDNVDLDIIDEEPKVYSWDARKKIDPKDYTIDGKVGETIFKMPGSVNGMQFIIQNLEVF